MLYAAALALGVRCKFFFHLFGKEDTLLQERILKHAQKDVPLWRIRVVVVVFLVVIFVKDDRVFPLGHLQVVLRSMQAHDVSFGAMRSAGARHVVAVDGDKQIGIVAVGDGSTLVQGDKDIAVAGEDDPDAREIQAHLFRQFQGDSQGKVLLLRTAAEATRVMPAMARVNDYGFYLVIRCGNCAFFDNFAHLLAKGMKLGTPTGQYRQAVGHCPCRGARSSAAQPIRSAMRAGKG